LSFYGRVSTFLGVATNETGKKANGKKPPKARPLSYKRRPVPRPTAAQLQAMRAYVRRSGHKFSKQEIDEIRSQWRD
jgi:hypothetical protein